MPAEYFYLFAVPPSPKIEYTFPNINLLDEVPSDTRGEIFRSPLTIINTKFGRSLWFYCKSIITQSTKYFDPVNCGFIIANYNALFQNMTFLDMNGLNIPEELFCERDIMIAASLYGEWLMIQMLQHDHESKLTETDFLSYNFRRFHKYDPMIKKYVDYLASTTSLSTDPETDALFENPIISINY
jgi:hypothetical protein